MCREEELTELYSFITAQSDRITQLCRIVEDLIGAVKEVGHALLEEDTEEEWESDFEEPIAKRLHASQRE